MEINSVGSTAILVANLRALEKKRDLKFFNDPYAHWFIDDEIREKVEHLKETLPESSEFICYRFYKLTEIINREIKKGKKQIVLLGAGLDMRSQMFADEDVIFYEVDQPSILKFKHDVIKKHGVTPCTSIPCDYLEVDLGSELIERGFDIDKPTLFVWEGNSMYLPIERIHDFFNLLRKNIPSFSIVFDYFSDKFINRQSGNERLDKLVDIFEEKIGAKWITGFKDLKAFEEKNGFIMLENGDILEEVGREIDTPPESISEVLGIWYYCVLEAS